MVAPHKLQVPLAIHSIMQDSNNGNTVSRHAKVNHVPFNVTATITWADVIAGDGSFGLL